MRAQAIVGGMILLLGSAAAPADDGAFAPPPGAKVIYRCDFDSGLDGWSGELTKDSQMPGSKAALAIDDAFCKSVTHWALDPEGLLKRREQVSRLLESAISLVGRGEFEKFQAKRIADREALEAKRLEENRQRAVKELKEAEPKK